jgi:hypothetical protein
MAEDSHTAATVRTRSRRAHLHLASVAQAPARALAPESVALSLRRSPFRPGELPVRLAVDLEPDTRASAIERALAAGVPVSLWIRVSVEASRVASAIGQIDGVTAAAVLMAIEDVRRADEDPAALDVHARRLRAYARALGHQPDRATPPDGAVSVLLPDEMAACWRTSAEGPTSRHGPLSAWSKHLRMPSPGNVRQRCGACRSPSGATRPGPGAKRSPAPRRSPARP